MIASEPADRDLTIAMALPCGRCCCVLRASSAPVASRELRHLKSRAIVLVAAVQDVSDTDDWWVSSA